VAQGTELIEVEAEPFVVVSVELSVRILEDEVEGQVETPEPVVFVDHRLFDEQVEVFLRDFAPVDAQSVELVQLDQQ